MAWQGQLELALEIIIDPAPGHGIRPAEPSSEVVYIFMLVRAEG